MCQVCHTCQESDKWGRWGPKKSGRQWFWYMICYIVLGQWTVNPLEWLWHKRSSVRLRVKGLETFWRESLPFIKAFRHHMCITSFTWVAHFRSSLPCFFFCKSGSSMNLLSNPGHSSSRLQGYLDALIYMEENCWWNDSRAWGGLTDSLSLTTSWCILFPKIGRLGQLELSLSMKNTTLLDHVGIWSKAFRCPLAKGLTL